MVASRSQRDSTLAGKAAAKSRTASLAVLVRCCLGLVDPSQVNHRMPSSVGQILLAALVGLRLLVLTRLGIEVPVVGSRGVLVVLLHRVVLAWL